MILSSRKQQMKAHNAKGRVAREVLGGAELKAAAKSLLLHRGRRPRRRPIPRPRARLFTPNLSVRARAGSDAVQGIQKPQLPRQVGLGTAGVRKAAPPPGSVGFVRAAALRASDATQGKEPSGSTGSRKRMKIKDSSQVSGEEDSKVGGPGDAHEPGAVAFAGSDSPVNGITRTTARQPHGATQAPGTVSARLDLALSPMRRSGARAMTAREARGAVRQILSDSGAFSSEAGERIMAEALQGFE